MAKKKKQEEDIKEEILPVESDEQVEHSSNEEKEVEDVVSKELGGNELKQKVKLVAKKVFEPMQGLWKTVWVK